MLLLPYLILAALSFSRSIALIPLYPFTYVVHPKFVRLQLSLHDIMNDDVLIQGGATAAMLLCVSSFMPFSDEARRQREQLQKLEQERQEERARLAFIAPRPIHEPWTEEELKAFDGKSNPEGPILIAVAGKVYNVYKGRHFYGPGGEYSIFAGRDATRLLAKFRTEDEDEESLSKPLTMSERATLEAYIWKFKEKYDFVGILAEFDPRDISM
jgi:membrane-associated progesterone receptor component